MTVLAAGGTIGAGFLGFLVVLALAVGAVFLFRSMSRHLRKVPPTFDPPPERAAPDRPRPDESPPDDSAADRPGRDQSPP